MAGGQRDPTGAAPKRQRSVAGPGQPGNDKHSPARIRTRFGAFDCRNLKQDAFFGYHGVPDGSASILVADPEKALLDHWHLAAGEWTADRLGEMRYQNADRVTPDRLRAYAASTA